LKLFVVAILLAAQTALSATPGVIVKVSLFPAGSFEIKSDKIEGKGKKVGKSYTADELKVPVDSLDTGINLRNEHMRKRLSPKGETHVVVKNVKAGKDSGTAMITVGGVTKEITFKSKDNGDGTATATFDLNLPDFEVKDVNYKGVGVEDTVSVEATVPYEGN
jgi:hypothetical protein